MKKTINLFKSIIIVSFFAILFWGCSYSTYYVQTGSRVFEEANYEDVKLYSGEPKEEYKVIGSIAIDYAGDTEGAMKYLQKKAALLGANAVIFMKINTVFTASDRLAANGVAVKLTK